MLVLQCSIRGKKASNFVTSIDENASVLELMELILRNHQYSIPCCTAELTLSSGSPGGDQSDEVDMDRTKALGDYFPPRPSFQHDELYHVVVTLPAALGPDVAAAVTAAPATKKQKVTELGDMLPSTAVSVPQAADIPTTLLCAAFGVFEDNCKQNGLANLTKRDCELVFFLCRALTEDFGSDEELETRLKELFGDYFLTEDSMFASQHSSHARAALPFELKVHNERVNRNSDAYLMNLSNTVCDSVPPPYLLLEISGPFLRVYGVVNTGKKLYCELLAFSVPLVWLDKLSLMESAARTCAALKIAIEELRTAQSAAPSNSSTVMDFPYKNVVLIDGERVTIQYEERLLGLALVGNLVELDGYAVVIKFAKLRYGREVHEHCAANGLAPQLLAHEELPGGWHFCVMDMVKSSVPIWTVERSLVEPKLHEVLQILHAANFVHGDLRIYNILWDSDTQQLRLVDFDWAGVQGTTRYPPFLSPEIAWPMGVETNRIIEFAHDAFWIDEFLSA